MFRQSSCCHQHLFGVGALYATLSLARREKHAMQTHDSPSGTNSISSAYPCGVA